MNRDLDARLRRILWNITDPTFNGQTDIEEVEEAIAQIHKAYYEEYGPQLRELQNNMDKITKMLGIK